MAIKLDVNYGISRRAAEEILAEIGLEMSRFLFPGNHESAGKKLSGKTWLRKLLVEAALLRHIPRTPTYRLSITIWPPGEAGRKP